MAELEELRAAAEALGVKVDRRWGVDRLRAEVAAAQPPAGPLPPVDEDQGDEEHEHPGTGEPMDGAELPADGVERELVIGDEDRAGPVLRAGGHIDRGDGRGWVIEE